MTSPARHRRRAGQVEFGLICLGGLLAVFGMSSLPPLRVLPLLLVALLVGGIVTETTRRRAGPGAAGEVTFVVGYSAVIPLIPGLQLGSTALTVGATIVGALGAVVLAWVVRYRTRTPLAWIGLLGFSTGVVWLW